MIDPTNEIAPSAVSPDDMQTQADQAYDPLHDLVPVMAFESLPGQLASITSVDVPEFSQALLALRKVYEAQGLKRQQFNAMVCDELARRGEAPSGAAVLKVARWGSNGDVIEDVSKWYSSLAQRLSVRHAHIPDAVQHKASKLFEALWEHAATQIAAPLRDQMAAQKIVFDEETLRLKAEIALGAEVADKRDQDQQSSIASLSQDLQKACLDAEGKAMRISEVELNLANSQTALAVAERALVAAQQDYMRRISDAQAKALAEQAASQAVHDAIVQGLQAQLARLEADLSQQRKDGALAIDQARQDAKDAHKRADAAQRNVDGLLVEASGLKDRLSEQTIEMARLQRDIAQAGERVTAAERLSEDLRGQLAASQESLATLAKGALVSKKDGQ
jgi:hypothetical protein